MQTIEISKTPLIIIDVQNGFVNDNSKCALPDIKRLIDLWHAKAAPVIFTKFINPPGSFWRTLIGWNRLAEAPETDIFPEIQPTKDDLVFEKHTYTSFTQEVLNLFQQKKWTAAVLCGIATDGCVLKTGVDAFEKQITPFIVGTACGSHAGPQLHEAGLLLLLRFVGKHQILSFEQLEKSLA